MFRIPKFITPGQIWKRSYSPVSDGESSVDDQEKSKTDILKLYAQIRLMSFLCAGLLLLTLLQVAYNAFGLVLPTRSVSGDGGFHLQNLLLAPEFPLVTKVFENGHIIKEITAEVEAVWEADMPRGRGFVHVPNIHTKDPEDDIHVVSVFHQLHCLYMMQKSFTKAIKDASQLPEKEIWHTYHCAELLRQALKCAADPTLDRTVHLASSPTGRGTSGWNGTHVCRDFDSLFAWTDEHRTNDRIGAGILDGHHSEHGH